MTAFEVGKKLVEMCKAGKTMEAIDAFYSPEIVSIEAGAPPGKDPKTTGIKNVRAKSDWWIANHEVHSMQVTGPWPHGDRFIAGFTIDITPKTGPMTGRRFQMEEMGLYTVKDGKVIKEEFFYHMGG